MKFQINRRNYNLSNPRDVRDMETLAGRVASGFVKGLTAPPVFILAQINSAWRWLAGDKEWWR